MLTSDVPLPSQYHNETLLGSGGPLALRMGVEQIIYLIIIGYICT